MFERLLEVFFHAKAGALAGLLLVGTTGALVSATASSTNGVTTITLTQASASPSANNQVNNQVQTSPTASPTQAPNALITNLTAPKAATTTCDPTQAANAAAAVKTVDAAYSQYHTDLAQLRKDGKSDAARTLIENADKLIKDLRQSAVKAIHATASCSNDDNENVDEQNGDTNDDQTDASDANDANGEQGDNDGEHENDDDAVTPATAPTTPVVTATGDAKTIADNAVAAMKVAFDTAKSQLGTVNTTLATPKPKANPTFHADSKGKNDKGGNHGD